MRTAVLLTLLAVAAPAGALDIDFDSNPWCYENPRTICTIQLRVRELATDIDVDYTWSLPKGQSGSGTLTVRQFREHEAKINGTVINDFVYNGTTYGEATISYLPPGAAERVTRTATISVIEDETLSLVLSDLRVVESNSAIHELPIRMHPAATIPVTISGHGTNGSAVRDFDYQVLDFAVPFTPGMTSGVARFRTPADGANEGVETFTVVMSTDQYPSSSTSATVAIVDTDAPVVITPEPAVVFNGDRVVLNMAFPHRVPTPATATATSSNRGAAYPWIPILDIQAGAAFAPLYVQTNVAGNAVITVDFPVETGFPAATALVQVFGGEVSFGDGNALSLHPGDQISVPIRVTPPPPAPFGLYISESRPGIVSAETAVEVGTDGEATLPIRAEAVGKTTIDLLTGGERIAASIEVTVVEGLSLGDVVPRSGPAAGGTTVTITGAGFQAPCTVRFGEIAATDVTIVDSGTIRANTPRHAPGVADVSVACGGSARTLAGAFTFKPARKRSVRH
jgi:hypothetical protein